MDQRGCQNPAGSQRRREQRRGGLPALPCLQRPTTLCSDSYRRVISLKKATVVAETSLILGKYRGCFVVLIVTVMNLQTLYLLHMFFLLSVVRVRVSPQFVGK